MAVVMCLTMFAVTSSAAKAPTISVASNVSSAKVGDTVKVTVSTSKNSKLCAVTFSLKYDSAYLQVVNATGAGAFASEMLNQELKNEVRYVGATATYIADSATTLFTVEFKVIKTGGKVTFSASEAYVVEGDNFDAADVTSKIAEKSVTIACSHGNKQETITKQATCTAKGEKTIKCKDCGKDFGKTEIAAKGHTPGNWEVKKAATCTEAGENVKKCTVCKAVVETKAVAKKGHDFESPKVVKEATCTEKGLKEGKCKNCGQTAKEEIPMKAHTPGAWEVKTAATCSQEGQSVKKCTVCKTVVEARTDAKKAHTPGNWEVKTAPTCTKEGESVKKCTVCKAVVETRKDAKKAHTPGDWEVKTAATCTKEGESVKKCTVCKAVVDTRKDAKKAHTLGDWEVSVEATVSKPGKMVKKCTVCKAVVETKEYTIGKLGDVSGDGKISALDVRKTLQYTAGKIELTPTQIALADVTGDGKISALDARWLLQVVAGSRVL